MRRVSGALAECVAATTVRVKWLREHLGSLATALVIAAAAFVTVTGSPGNPDRDLRQPLRPDPAHPERDRSAMQDDGCLVTLERTDQRPCAYGDRRSGTTVVLFGDSLAMAYFPAIEALARRHGWRLVGITKAGCPPVDATVFNHRLERSYRECSVWRRQAVRRIEGEQPDLILVTGRMSTAATRGGRRLGARASRVALEGGYVRTLRRLRGAAGAVVALKDLPRSPRNVPDCIVRHRDRLHRCAFASTPANTERLDARAVAAVPGVRMIDLTRVICPQGICRPVIGGAIVYRDYEHMTPTFARSLASIIERRLPAVP